MIVGKPIAVVDTNVIVDLYSWHDFNEHFERLITTASLPGVPIDDPTSLMRITRARDALLLAICFHKTNAITFSLSESVTLLNRLTVFDRDGKPLPDDERIRRLAFTKTFLWFVKTRLLTGWKDAMRDSDLKGNDADRAFVAYAKENELPLITNEGFGPLGINKKSLMQKLAREQGVRIIQAIDFYADKMDDMAEGIAFFLRFRAEAPEYLKWYVKRHPEGKKAVQQILRDLGRHYEYLLSDDPRAPRLKPLKFLTYR
jgi:hypothetical protein